MKKQRKLGFFALIGLAAVASLFTVCKAHGSGGDYQGAGQVEIWKVAFNADGGLPEPVPNPVTVAEGETIGELPEDDPAKEGWTFGGWYRGDVQFDPQTPVSGDITLRAKWIGAAEAGHYHVTFDGDGGSPATQVEANVSEGGTVSPLPGVTRPGYTFGGWWTEEDGDGTPFTASTPVTGAATLHAKWLPVTYTVSYDGNGATGGATLSRTHTYDVPEHLRANGYTRTGHGFDGWAESETGGAVYQDEDEVVNLSATQGSTVTLHAVWTAPPSPHALILNPLGGTWKDGSGFSGLPSLTLDPGEGIALPSEPDIITKSENFLVSWNTAPDSSGTDYLQGQHFVPDADITLYARWALGDTWVDKSAAEAAIAAAENAIQNAGGGETVIMIGNPSAGNAPQPVLCQIDYLMGLLDGHRVDVPINDGAGTITVTLYNIPAIQKGTADLTALVAQYHPGVIVVPKWTFVYNGTNGTDGSVQSALLVTAGTYEIELEGAAGGHMYTAAGLTSSAGKGGHALGRYRFDGTAASPTELEVRVGGQGEGTAGYDGMAGFTEVTSFPNSRTKASTHPGGWNGGGSGGYATGFNGASGGGGATDVRLAGSGTTLTGVAFSDPRIIAAGGGGGAASSGTGTAGFGLANNTVLTGGDGGGVLGLSGQNYEKSPVSGYVTLPVSTESGYSGGTATSSKVILGRAGFGANGIAGSDGRGGGGAGWWGGCAANKTDTNGLVGGGGGGSGYTGGTTAHPVGVGVISTPYDGSSPEYSGPVNETIPGTVYGSGKATIRWIKQ
jgi:uncharacterized repeat protein (TIGR02543 family)